MLRVQKAVVGVVVVGGMGGVACARPHTPVGDAGWDKTALSAPNAPTAAAPTATPPTRPGMQWIPRGILRAGSAPNEVPRVADAELAGVAVPMDGFYVDVLPWPNEPGAISTTNLTREEAQRLCASKAKRLCTELEWERACKGPGNARYEYGNEYDARVCGTGASAESSARRPSDRSGPCQSGFGVRQMHGGAWEWTDSAWGRGATHDLGVLRGGNDPAGDVASRCAYARPFGPTERSPSTGFRCCAGARNEPEVRLDVTVGLPFERARHVTRPSPPLDALGGAACGPPQSPSPCSSSRAWTWRPQPNVELSLAGGCLGRWPGARCALAVSRTVGEEADTLAQIDTGRAAPDVILLGAADRRIRVRGQDAHGRFVREIVFSYGRVDVR